MRVCSDKVNDLLNITEAKKACDRDQECPYLSTDNMNCEGDFKICNGTHLKYHKNGCTLLKGQYTTEKLF